MHPAKECSIELARQAESVCQRLLPGGKRKANHWLCGDIGGGPGKSMQVTLEGPKAGLFYDHADPSCTGDLVTLWAMVNGLSIGDALPQIQDYLGMPSTDHRQDTVYYKKPEPPRDPRALTKDMIAWFEGRGITREVLKNNNVARDGSAFVYPLYSVKKDKPVAFRYRMNLEDGSKKFWNSTDTAPAVFGRHGVSPLARELVLNEGYEDAMLLQSWGFDAVSVPFGGGDGDKQQWIEYEFDWLASFDTIYWCQDADEAGRAATKELIERLGYDRLKIIKLGHKDPTDWRAAGGTKEGFRELMDGAHGIDIDTVVSARLYHNQLLEYRRTGGMLAPDRSFKFPFNSDYDWVLPEHSFTIYTGHNEVGKSTFLSQLSLMFAREGMLSIIMSMEINPIVTLSQMVDQVAGSTSPTPEYEERCVEYIEDNIFLYGENGIVTPESILQSIEYAFKRHGVKLFVIDSLLTIGIAEQDVDGLMAFANALVKLKMMYPIYIVLVCHQTKPNNMDGKNPDPTKYGIRGIGSLSDIADFILGHSRVFEKMSETMPDAFIHALKWRYGIKPKKKLGLYFDESSKQLRRGPRLEFI